MKKYISILLSAMLLFCVALFHVSAEEPYAIDTAVLPAGSKYQGDKDIAFEKDGDTLHFYIEVGYPEGTTTQKLIATKYGYCTEDAYLNWFYKAGFRSRGKVFLNGSELPEWSPLMDDNAIYFQKKTPTIDPAPDGYFMANGYELVIKPGVEITEDFFAHNQLVFESWAKNATEPSSTITVGNNLEPAKAITPADDYRVVTEINQLNNLVMKVENDSDSSWAGKLTQVTCQYGDNDPVDMTIGTGTLGVGSDNTVRSVGTGNGNVAAVWSSGTTYIGVKQTFFADVPVGETRDYTFTFKADGYEDSVVKQTVRNPKEVLEVAVDKGVKTSFALEDLQKMWEDEGSKEYTYSVYDSIPDVLEQEKHYGPSLKAVLAAAKIDFDSLADDDVIELSTASNSSLGYKARITVKDLKEKRYSFPNGASTNNFKGTTSAQLEGKTEVPYIISLKGGENNLRNIFGQKDPQEEQKYDWVQYLGKITVYKGTATTYDGLTPTIASGSKVKKGDKLDFDFSTTGWQAGTATYAGIYYTVSTDGTEPADPTLSDVFYNYRQYGNPSYKTNPEYFNSYEFTDAEKTIIKVMTYIRGYAEPKVTTLTYTHDHVVAAAVKENEKAATCTDAGSYDEVVYCSECKAEISREAKTVDALGHKAAILPGKDATCTEKGRTEGEVCSRCGETLKEQKEIAALGHDYKDGVCTRCGEKDPNYVEPTPEEPVVKLNGLEKGKDGKWALYDDDVVQKNFTGLAKSSYTKNWYYVKNGYVDWNYTGFGQNVNTKKWYRVKDGRVDWDANSIYKKPETGAWYKCYEGRVTFNQTGVYKNENGWWYCKNSKVDFNFTGIASNKNGTWYIKTGYVDFNKNGKVTYNGKTYNVTNGRARLS